MMDDVNVPKHYYVGTRIGQILRLCCSGLNVHTSQRFISDDPSCKCGFHLEDTEQFLLNCPLFSNMRRDYLLALLQLHVNALSVEYLLYGSNNFSYNLKTNIVLRTNVFNQKQTIQTCLTGTTCLIVW